MWKLTAKGAKVPQGAQQADMNTNSRNEVIPYQPDNMTIGPELYKLQSKWKFLLCSERFTDKKQDDSLAFEQDYNRVVNCPAFRRLQDKAQLFPLVKDDYARTRLTHSIECSAIAEEMGVRVLDFLKQKEDYLELCCKIPTILKTAALLHDMGNPPFGHFGEDVIQNWFKEQFAKVADEQSEHEFLHEKKYSKEFLQNEEYINDFCNFDGNTQLFRLITNLDNVGDYNRLSLTYATLASVMKYLSNSSEIDKSKSVEIDKSKSVEIDKSKSVEIDKSKSVEIDKSKSVLARKKLGYFSSEKDLFKQIRDKVKLDGVKRHPLTYLLEAADDIAYLTSDLQDACKKEVISWEQIEETFTGITDITQLLRDIKLIKDDSIRFEKLHTFLRIKIIMDVVEAFKKNYELIMEGTYNEELIKASNSALIAERMRNLLKDSVYCHPSIYCPEIKAHTILTKLLDVFVSAVLDYEGSGKEQKKSMGDLNRRIIEQFSDNYRATCNKRIEAETDNAKKTYHKLLLATDFICGMTDSYAQQMYNFVVAHPSDN